MKEFLLKHRFGLMLIIPGFIGGYLYWKYVGCVSGTCPLKSNFYYMVVFGSLIGYFLGDLVDEYVEKKKKKSNEL